jgi:WD40 repeat protein
VVGEIEGKIVIVSGALDGTIRIWEAQAEGSTELARARSSDSISSIALDEVCGRQIVTVGTTYGQVSLWDGQTGGSLGASLDGVGSISSLSLGLVGGNLVVAAGAHNGSLRLCDVQTGDTLLATKGNQDNEKMLVSLGAIKGRSLIASAYEGAIKLRDARTGKIMCKTSGAQLVDMLEAQTGELLWETQRQYGSIGRLYRSVRKLLRMERMIVLMIQFAPSFENPIVVSSKGGYIVVSDAVTCKVIGRAFAGMTPSIFDSSALGLVDNRLVWTTPESLAIDPLLIWDVNSGRPVRFQLGVGEDKFGEVKVQLVTIGKIGDRDILVLGGKDGVLSVWDIGGATLPEFSKNEVVLEEFMENKHSVEYNVEPIRIAPLRSSIDLGGPICAMSAVRNNRIAVATTRGVMILSFDVLNDLTRAPELPGKASRGPSLEV